MRVYSQRTQKEYTAFMQELAALYPNAVKIQLVQDNLNTQKPNSFYNQLSADEAFTEYFGVNWFFVSFGDDGFVILARPTHDPSAE